MKAERETSARQPSQEPSGEIWLLVFFWFFFFLPSNLRSDLHKQRGHKAAPLRLGSALPSAAELGTAGTAGAINTPRTHTSTSGPPGTCVSVCMCGGG